MTNAQPAINMAKRQSSPGIEPRHLQPDVSALCQCIDHSLTSQFWTVPTAKVPSSTRDSYKPPRTVRRGGPCISKRPRTQDYVTSNTSSSTPVNGAFNIDACPSQSRRPFVLPFGFSQAPYKSEPASTGNDSPVMDETAVNELLSVVTEPTAPTPSFDVPVATIESISGSHGIAAVPMTVPRETVFQAAVPNENSPELASDETIKVAIAPESPLVTVVHNSESKCQAPVSKENSPERASDETIEVAIAPESPQVTVVCNSESKCPAPVSNSSPEPASDETIEVDTATILAQNLNTHRHTVFGMATFEYLESSDESFEDILFDEIASIEDSFVGEASDASLACDTSDNVTLSGNDLWEAIDACRVELEMNAATEVAPATATSDDAEQIASVETDHLDTTSEQLSISDDYVHLTSASESFFSDNTAEPELSLSTNSPMEVDEDLCPRASEMERRDDPRRPPFQFTFSYLPPSLQPAPISQPVVAPIAAPVLPAPASAPTAKVGRAIHHSTLPPTESHLRAVVYWLAVHTIGRLAHPEPALPGFSGSSPDEWCTPYVDMLSTQRMAAGPVPPMVEFSDVQHPPTPVLKHRPFGKVPNDPYDVLLKHGNATVVAPAEGLFQFILSAVKQRQLSVEAVVAAAWYIDRISVHSVDGTFGANMRRTLCYYNETETYPLERRLIMLGLYLAQAHLEDDHWSLATYADSFIVPLAQAQAMERAALKDFQYCTTIGRKPWFDHCNALYNSIARLRIRREDINWSLLDLCHKMVMTARLALDEQIDEERNWATSRAARTQVLADTILDSRVDTSYMPGRNGYINNMRNDIDREFDDLFDANGYPRMSYMTRATAHTAKNIDDPAIHTQVQQNATNNVQNPSTGNHNNNTQEYDGAGPQPVVDEQSAPPSEFSDEYVEYDGAQYFPSPVFEQHAPPRLSPRRVVAPVNVRPEQALVPAPALNPPVAPAPPIVHPEQPLVLRAPVPIRNPVPQQLPLQRPPIYDTDDEDSYEEAYDGAPRFTPPYFPQDHRRTSAHLISQDFSSSGFLYNRTPALTTVLNNNNCNVAPHVVDNTPGSSVVQTGAAALIASLDTSDTTDDSYDIPYDGAVSFPPPRIATSQKAAVSQGKVNTEVSKGKGRAAPTSALEEPCRKRQALDDTAVAGSSRVTLEEFSNYAHDVRSVHARNFSCPDSPLSDAAIAAIHRAPLKSTAIAPAEQAPEIPAASTSSSSVPVDNTSLQLLEIAEDRQENQPADPVVRSSALSHATLFEAPPSDEAMDVDEDLYHDDEEDLDQFGYNPLPYFGDGLMANYTVIHRCKPSDNCLVYDRPIVEDSRVPPQPSPPELREPVFRSAFPNRKLPAAQRAPSTAPRLLPTFFDEEDRWTPTQPYDVRVLRNAAFYRPRHQPRPAAPSPAFDYPAGGHYVDEDYGSSPGGSLPPRPGAPTPGGSESSSSRSLPARPGAPTFDAPYRSGGYSSSSSFSFSSLRRPGAPVFNAPGGTFDYVSSGSSRGPSSTGTVFVAA